MLALILPRNFDRTCVIEVVCVLVLCLHMYGCMDVLMLEHLPQLLQPYPNFDGFFLL
jgi:hypothetical protein